MKMTKCNKCLRGARLSITGTNKITLKIDMGGAIIYLMPKENGIMEVALNSENLVEGDYSYAIWTGNEWLVSCGNDKNNCT